MVIVHELNETWEKTRRDCNTNDADFDARIVILENAGQIKDMVKVATTANITLSGTQTIDGVAVVAGNRVLVKNQTDAEDNGIYLVAASAWSRATDFDAAADLSKGCTVKVEKGTAGGDKYYTLTTDTPITLGTTDLAFAEFDAYGATDANTAGKVVKRDSSGNFSAGTITAALSGNVTGNVTGNCSGSSGSCTGNAATATAATNLAPGTGGYENAVNLGNGFLWLATDGKVYIKAGATAPTSDTDGTIVGTQSA